jgi:AraC-like DNA-binding protein
VIPEHSLGYTLSGSIQIDMAGKQTVAGAGSCGLFRRNQLGRFVKQPPADGGVFQSVSISFDQEILRSFSREYGAEAKGPYTGLPFRDLSSHRLLDNFFQGFLPWFEPENKMEPVLVDLKVKEALHLLLHIAPDLKDWLFDFGQPGKIDLEEFMQKNFMYNVPMSRLAQLSGRSLSSFKTDFEKIFKKSPGRWLLERRLSEAFWLIREKGRRASDIYLDLGFEDLSHFSFAFKKQFGVPPSLV